MSIEALDGSRFVNELQDKYMVIPRSILTDTRLSCDARLAAIYMSSMPEGCLPSVCMVRQALGFGDHVWRKVSRELRALGLLEDVTLKDESKAAVGKGLRFKGL